MSDAMTVSVLGAGALGVAMAARLVETGHPVLLWDRRTERAEDAAGDTGAEAVTSVGEAVGRADAVLTVLTDGDVVTQVIGDALEEFGEHTVWIQTSTVGPRSATELAALAAEHGVAYLDAPVSGSTQPARQGSLVWLVAGPDEVLRRARPVLEDLGSNVQHVGHEQQGSALKLAVNAWMTAATVAMSDVLALCDALEVPHDTFVSAIEAGPLAMPYELQKIEMMRSGSYPPGFAVHLALKDLDLATTDTAETAPPSPLLALVAQRLRATVAAGHGDDDLAAVDHARART